MTTEASASGRAMDGQAPASGEGAAGQCRLERPGPSVVRWSMAAMGVVCVGVALVGVFVPGLPTTVFLIAASYLLARSCPELERRMLRARVFRPYLRYVRGDSPMPRRARLVALAAMWAAIGGTLWLGTGARTPSTWFVGTMLAAGAVGTAAILRFRRARSVERARDDRVRDAA